MGYIVFLFVAKFSKKWYISIVSKVEKILSRVLCGRADKNIAFEDLCYLLEKLGFQRRVKGDHYIYHHEGIKEIINIQPKGAGAKPYQVKQVSEIIVKNKLGEREDA